MTPSLMARILPAAVVGAALLLAQAVVPQMKSVDPDTVKQGDVLTVVGENLDKESVAEVYLTDGKNDVKLVITEQGPESIKCKVPASVKPGRLALMVLTKGKDQKYIEQPVKVTIE